MRSDKQKESSRRNGAKSRGPVTDAGRQRSAQNAAKHHITSLALLIPGESAEELDAHFAAYHARFQPADAVELDLIDNLAFIAWRQRRLWRREADMITRAAGRLPDEDRMLAPQQAASRGWQSLSCGPAIALLHREEAGLRRAWDRTLRSLLELRQIRPKPPAATPPSETRDRVLQNEPEALETPKETNILEAGPGGCGAPEALASPPARALSGNGNGFVLSPAPAGSCDRAPFAQFLRTS